jgi:hypothetical protein
VCCVRLLVLQCMMLSLGQWLSAQAAACAGQGGFALPGSLAGRTARGSHGEAAQVISAGTSRGARLAMHRDTGLS